MEELFAEEKRVIKKVVKLADQLQKLILSEQERIKGKNL